MIVLVSGKGGVDQRQTADTPPEHQQDQYQLRKLSKLRRYAERQTYRSDGGSRFKQTNAERKSFQCADGACAGKKQRQIQNQDSGGVFYGGAVDAAAEKLRRFPLTEYGLHIRRKHGDGRHLHAARG